MMSVEQMGLLFQLLIAQNKETMILDIFPGNFKKHESAILGNCDVVYEKYGVNIHTVEIRLQWESVVRYRINTSYNKTDFVTWDKRGTTIFNVYEQYLQYLLKFVSFEDKV